MRNVLCDLYTALSENRETLYAYIAETLLCRGLASVSALSELG